MFFRQFHYQVIRANIIELAQFCQRNRTNCQCRTLPVRSEKRIPLKAASLTAVCASPVNYRVGGFVRVPERFRRPTL